MYRFPKITLENIKKRTSILGIKGIYDGEQLSENILNFLSENKHSVSFLLIFSEVILMMYYFIRHNKGVFLILV